MALVDPGGRLFGKLHLLDATAALLLLAVAGVTAYFFFTLSGLKIIQLQDVEPSHVIIGQHQMIRIRGSGFTPDCIVKLSEHNLGRPVLVGQGFLDVLVSSEIPPGLYHPLVVGRHHSALSVRPISVSWKPKILEVSPRSFLFWEPVEMEIAGELFQPGCTARLGEIPLDLEYVHSERLKARLPANSARPGSYVLKIANPSGESSAFHTFIHATGTKGALLMLVIHLSTEGLLPEQREMLKRFESGQPIVFQAEVQFAHPLYPAKYEPTHPYTIAPAKRKFSLWKRNVEQEPEKPRARSGPKMEYRQLPLVHVALWATAQYTDNGVEYIYVDKPLEAGSWIQFVMNDVSFSGRVLSPPVLVSEQPPEATS